MNTELEHLKKMRALLANGWTQYVVARDNNGDPVEPNSPDATYFCLIGASNRVAPSHEIGRRALRRMVVAILEQTGSLINLSKWNDDPKRTHAEVLALVDRAIEIAEAEQ